MQHTVNKLARTMSAPTELDLRRLKRVTRYMIGPRQVKLLMKPSDGNTGVCCWIDAHWADDPETRKSVSGGVLMFHGVMIDAVLASHVKLRSRALRVGLGGFREFVTPSSS